MVRPLLASLGFLACTATSGPFPSGPAATPPTPETAPPSAERGELSGQPNPQPPRTSFEARLDALETWLEGRTGVERVRAPRPSLSVSAECVEAMRLVCVPVVAEN